MPFSALPRPSPPRPALLRPMGSALHCSSWLSVGREDHRAPLHTLSFCLSQDLPGALSEAQIAESMGLHDIKTRPWSIFKTSAIKGDGLFEVRARGEGEGEGGGGGR